MTPPLRDNLLIIAVFMALLLMVLLLSKKHRGRSDGILAALFLVYGLTLFLSYMELFNQQYGYPYPALVHTSVPVILLHGPVLWLYVVSLTDQRFRFRPWYLLHFVPFLFVTVAMTTTVYALPVEEKIGLVTSQNFRDQWLFPVTVVLIALTTQGYYTWGLVMLYRHKRRIKLYFSRLSGIDLKWLRFLLLLAMISYAGISGLYVVNYFYGFLNYGVMQSAGAVLASIYILGLGFYGLKQQNIFAGEKVDMNLQQTTQWASEKSELAREEEQFIDRLLEYMRSEKPHLEPELTLAELSQQLATRPEYLSKILNSRLHKNFFDFVNHYRIEEFKEQCRDPQNRKLTLLSIAYDCGFSSKATFNRVFRNAT